MRLYKSDLFQSNTDSPDRLRDCGGPGEKLTQSLIANQALVVALYISNRLLGVPAVAKGVHHSAHVPVLVAGVLDQAAPEIWKAHAKTVVEAHPTTLHRKAKAWHPTDILCYCHSLQVLASSLSTGPGKEVV